MASNQPVPSPPTATAVGSTLVAGVLFPSLSRTVAGGPYTTDERFNPNCKGIRLFIVNDGAGGSTATVKIQVKDPVSDTFIDLAGATSAAIGASTGTIVTIYPGLTGIADAAGVTINQHLGCAWRAVLTIAVATGTASVGAEYLL